MSLFPLNSLILCIYKYTKYERFMLTTLRTNRERGERGSAV